MVNSEYRKEIKERYGLCKRYGKEIEYIISTKHINCYGGLSERGSFELNKSHEGYCMKCYEFIFKNIRSLW